MTLHRTVIVPLQCRYLCNAAKGGGGGIQVIVPPLPNTEAPVLEQWVDALTEVFTLTAPHSHYATLRLSPAVCHPLSITRSLSPAVCHPLSVTRCLTPNNSLHLLLTVMTAYWTVLVDVVLYERRALVRQAFTIATTNSPDIHMTAGWLSQ